MYVHTQTRTHQYTPTERAIHSLWSNNTHTHKWICDTLKTLCACTISIRHTHTHHAHTPSAQVYVHVTSRRIGSPCMGIRECVYIAISTKWEKRLWREKKIDFALWLTIKFLNSIWTCILFINRNRFYFGIWQRIDSASRRPFGRKILANTCDCVWKGDYFAGEREKETNNIRRNFVCGFFFFFLCVVHLRRVV